MSGVTVFAPDRVALPGVIRPRLAPLMARQALIDSGLDRVFAWAPVSGHRDVVAFCMPGKRWPLEAYPVTDVITFHSYGEGGGRYMSFAEFFRIARDEMRA